MKKKIFAFIFAREGSKGIKNKNLAKLNGKPLLDYSIDLAKKLNIFQKIYVCTESKKISNYARKKKVDIILRPKFLATDNSPEYLSWQYALNFLKKKKISFDVFVSLPTTSPLREKSDVIGALNKLKKKTDFVVCASKARRNPWFNMLIKKRNGYYRLINDTKNKISNRQDAPKVYDMTTICYISTPNFILKNSSFHDGNLDVYVSKKINSIDIDEKIDLKIAEKLRGLK